MMGRVKNHCPNFFFSHSYHVEASRAVREIGKSLDGQAHIFIFFSKLGRCAIARVESVYCRRKSWSFLRCSLHHMAEILMRALYTACT